MSSDRHNVHYLFCHTILPGLAFGSGVQWDVFSAAFFGRDGPQVLSNLWNSMCGKFPELLTTADDFKREIRPVTDDWKAVVVTPPPALEGAEAHHIGVLIQLDPKRIAELSLNEKPINDRSLAGTDLLRYLCLEMHVTFPSMTMIDTLGYAGMDFCIIDSEHGPISMETAADMVIAADGTDVAPIIRVGDNDERLILRALDIGSAGVQVPQINDPDDARKLVNSAKYSPIGERGLSIFTRAGDYFKDGAPGHTDRQNEETVVIGHIGQARARQSG